jgi:hypothetical protein
MFIGIGAWFVVSQAQASSRDVRSACQHNCLATTRA